MLALMRNFNHYTLYTPYLEVLPNLPRTCSVLNPHQQTIQQRACLLLEGCVRLQDRRSRRCLPLLFSARRFDPDMDANI